MIGLLDWVVSVVFYLLRILGGLTLCMILALVLYAILQVMMGKK